MYEEKAIPRVDMLHTVCHSTCAHASHEKSLQQNSEAVNGNATVLPQIIPHSTIPCGLFTTLWGHQEQAFQFAMRAFASHGACMLALEMGTGKTLVTLRIHTELRPRLTLVCCPLRVVDVWPEEISKHMVDPPAVLALGADAGSVQEKTSRLSKFLKSLNGSPGIIVVNYDAVWREPLRSMLLAQIWDLIVADESHKLKSPSGKASKFFEHVGRRGRRRLALTGTPLPHGPLDVYAQYRYLAPSIFGRSFVAFRSRYAVMGGFQAKQVVGFRDLKDLEQKMGVIAMRVSKDVLNLLPPTDVPVRLDLGPQAKRVYRELDRDLIADVETGVVTAANAMIRLLRLQQVTSGVVPVEDSTPIRIDSSKMEALSDLIEGAGDEPVVVFCRFHADLDAVHEVCQALKTTSLELSGRKDQLQDWKSGKSQVIAVQISSGGAGVNLTRARYSIYYSLGFSLADYDQSRSRTHRPGQIRPVTYYHLIVKGTIDEQVYRALANRQDVINSIIDNLKGVADRGLVHNGPVATSGHAGTSDTRTGEADTGGEVPTRQTPPPSTSIFCSQEL